MDEAIKKQLDQFTEKTEGLMSKANEALTNAGKNSETLKEAQEAIDKLKKQYEENVTKAMADAEADKEKVKALQEHADALDVKLQELSGSKKEREEFGKVHAEIHKALKDSEKYAAYKSSPKGNKFAVELDNVKAGDMTTANTYTSDVVQADRQPGIRYNPVANLVRVRQLLPVGATDSNVVDFVRETAYDDGMAAKTEGQGLGQSDFDLEALQAPVRYIGTYAKVTEEMLEDTAGLTTYLNNILMARYGNEEDSQILYGSGVAPNITGLNGVLTAYADNGLADSNVNNYDVLVNAVTNRLKAKYAPNGILIAPGDYMNLILEKGTDGHYLYPMEVRTNGQFNVVGVPIFVSTAVAADDFFVGDWRQVAEIKDRRGVAIEFFQQDEDNVQKGFITVRITARLALPIYLPNAVEFGTFTNARALGSA